MFYISWLKRSDLLKKFSENSKVPKEYRKRRTNKQINNLMRKKNFLKSNNYF